MKKLSTTAVVVFCYSALSAKCLILKLKTFRSLHAPHSTPLTPPIPPVSKAPVLSIIGTSVGHMYDSKCAQYTCLFATCFLVLGWWQNWRHHFYESSVQQGCSLRGDERQDVAAYPTKLNVLKRAPSANGDDPNRTDPKCNR